MRIGSYQVLLELARGGMGKVYLARTVGPGGVERLVAIKRAHEHLLVASKDVAERFLDEARIAAHVHHSNVIGVHQAGSDGDGYYLVFDYVEGESLQGLIDAAGARGERVPSRIVLAIVLDALAGLHAAHEATDGEGRPLGILHRDVSAQNLLVGRDGVTRLTDFGIAKSALSLVVTDQCYVQGKLIYMSPEYLQRQPVDRTLDVYSMGMTLWIALIGGSPWPGAQEAQLLKAILVQGVPPLGSATTELAPQIAALVDKACHHDALERFQTAREMLDALEDVRDTIGGVARHAEVAEYVEAMAGAELAARRDLIKARRSSLEAEEEKSLAQAAAEGAAAAAPAPEVREIIGQAEEAVPVEQRVPTDAIRRSWEKPPLWRSLLYMAAVLVALAIGVAALAGRDAHTAGPPVQTVASVPAPISAAQGAPSEPGAPDTTLPARAGEKVGVDVTPTPPLTVVPTTAPPPKAARAMRRRTEEQRPRPEEPAPARDPGKVEPFSSNNPYR